MSADIFSVIITQQDRTLFLQELERVKKSLFSAQTEGKPNLSAIPLQDRNRDYWNEFVVDSHFSIASLERLRVELLETPLIRLSLAFEPDKDFLDNLAGVIRQKIGKKAILDYDVQPKLCAGIVYAIEGKIVDLSLETQLKTFDMRPIVDAQLPFLSMSS